jgi:sugar-specific transcriptional regulator TrmB
MSYQTNWAHDSNDSDVRRLKKEADKLARIACAAMEELIKHGKADFLVLKNDELREWWGQHQEDDRKERERQAEINRRKRIKEEALARLSDEEKELLGLAPAKKSKAKKGDLTQRIDDNLENLLIEKLQQYNWRAGE